MNKTSWQRLTLSLIGILVIVLCWRWAVCHLYTLPEAALSPFTSITTNAFYVVAAIVVFMVTGKLVYDWKNQTASVTNVLSEITHATQSTDERIIEQFANQYRDDASYAPIVPDTEEQFR